MGTYKSTNQISELKTITKYILAMVIFSLIGSMIIIFTARSDFVSQESQFILSFGMIFVPLLFFGIIIMFMQRLLFSNFLWGYDILIDNKNIKFQKKDSIKNFDPKEIKSLSIYYERYGMMVSGEFFPPKMIYAVRINFKKEKIVFLTTEYKSIEKELLEVLKQNKKKVVKEKSSIIGASYNIK